jgi:hypothetical protein
MQDDLASRGSNGSYWAICLGRPDSTAHSIHGPIQTDKNESFGLPTRCPYSSTYLPTIAENTKLNIYIYIKSEYNYKNSLHFQPKQNQKIGIYSFSKNGPAEDQQIVNITDLISQLRAT